MIRLATRQMANPVSNVFRSVPGLCKRSLCPPMYVIPEISAMTRTVTHSAIAAPPRSDDVWSLPALSISTTDAMNDMANTMRTMAVEIGRSALAENSCIKPSAINIIAIDMMADMAIALAMIIPGPVSLLMAAILNISVFSYEFIYDADEPDEEADRDRREEQPVDIRSLTHEHPPDSIVEEIDHGGAPGLVQDHIAV
jgi:hypothetical protein